MPKLIVVDRSGTEREIEAVVGRSVMENIRDAGFDELLALCGGCLSCATCHVHVDDSDLERLPPITNEEDELLHGSDSRTARSRLSCQLQFSDELVGLRVTISPED